MNNFRLNCTQHEEMALCFFTYRDTTVLSAHFHVTMPASSDTSISNHLYNVISKEKNGRTYNLQSTGGIIIIFIGCVHVTSQRESFVEVITFLIQFQHILVFTDFVLALTQFTEVTNHFCLLFYGTYCVEMF